MPPISTYSTTAGMFLLTLASLMSGPVAMTQGTPLEVSAVRFVSSNQAELIYEQEFKSNKFVETFQLKVGARSSLPEDFTKSLRVHITEGKTSLTNPSPLMVRDALVSYSVAGPNPVTSGIYEITVRANAAATGKTVRCSYIATDVSIENEYRVVPDAPGLSTASIYAVVTIQNSTKSSWGTANGTFLLGGYGIPEATTRVPRYQSIGAIPAGGATAQAAIRFEDKKILQEHIIDLSALANISQNSGPSHPKVTLKLVDWPEELQLPGDISVEGRGIRIPPPVLKVSGNTQLERLKSFKKNQKGMVTLDLDTMIHVQRTKSFPANIRAVAGLVFSHEVREVKFENLTAQSRTVQIQEDKSWGLVNTISSKPASTPTPPQSIPARQKEIGTLIVMEKQKQEDSLVVLLQPTFSIEAEIQRVNQGLKQIRLQLTGLNPIYFGAYSATNDTRKIQLNRVETISASAVAIEKFSKQCQETKESLEKAILFELARHPFPSPLSNRLQQELDANLRELRSRRDEVDQLLSRAAEEYNESIRNSVSLNLSDSKDRLDGIPLIIANPSKRSSGIAPQNGVASKTLVAPSVTSATMADLGKLSFSSKWLTNGKPPRHYPLSGLTFAEVDGDHHLLAIRDEKSEYENSEYGNSSNDDFLFEIKLVEGQGDSQSLEPVRTVQAGHPEFEDFEGLTFGADEAGANRLIACSEGSQPSIHKMKLSKSRSGELTVELDQNAKVQIPGTADIFASPVAKSWEGIVRTSNSLILIPESSMVPERQFLAIKPSSHKPVWYPIPNAVCSEFSGACLLPRLNNGSSDFIAILERNNGSAPVRVSKLHIFDASNFLYRGFVTLELKLPDGRGKLKGYCPEGIAAQKERDGWKLYLVNDPSPNWYEPVNGDASVSGASLNYIKNGVPLLFQGELKEAQIKSGSVLDPTEPISTAEPEVSSPNAHPDSAGLTKPVATPISPEESLPEPWESPKQPLTPIPKN